MSVIISKSDFTITGQLISCNYSVYEDKHSSKLRINFYESFNIEAKYKKLTPLLKKYFEAKTTFEDGDGFRFGFGDTRNLYIPNSFPSKNIYSVIVKFIDDVEYNIINSDTHKNKLLLDCEYAIKGKYYIYIGKILRAGCKDFTNYLFRDSETEEVLSLQEEMLMFAKLRM